MAPLVKHFDYLQDRVLEIVFSIRLVGNIPGKDIAKGEVLSDYVGSGPPQGNFNRYRLNLVYLQVITNALQFRHRSSSLRFLDLQAARKAVFR